MPTLDIYIVMAPITIIIIMSNLPQLLIFSLPHHKFHSMQLPVSQCVIYMTLPHLSILTLHTILDKLQKGADQARVHSSDSTTPMQQDLFSMSIPILITQVVILAHSIQPIQSRLRHLSRQHNPLRWCSTPTQLSGDIHGQKERLKSKECGVDMKLWDSPVRDVRLMAGTYTQKEGQMRTLAAAN